MVLWMFVAGATGGFFWLSAHIPVILYHKPIDSALLQWTGLIFYCNRFLFPFLKFLFYFVLPCFYLFVVDKNTWQTASLRMIHQPNIWGTEILSLARLHGICMLRTACCSALYYVNMYVWICLG